MDNSLKQAKFSNGISLPTLDELVRYFSEHLRTFTDEVWERCSFHGEYLRYQDNLEGVLLHCSYAGESTLKVEAWFLPPQKDKQQRNLAPSDLALYVIEIEEAHLTKAYPLSSTLAKDLILTQEDMKEYVIKEIRRIPRQIRIDIETKAILDRIPNLKFESYGGMVPFQAEGKWLDWDFYFRYRSGEATLRIGYWEETGPTKDSEDLISAPYWASHTGYGDEFDGCLNMDEFAKLFIELASNLGDGWFPYQFEEVEGEKRIFAPARTLDDALKLLEERSAKEERVYSRTPSKQDDRVFPAERPDFLVLPV